jgi:hypothetical protein
MRLVNIVAIHCATGNLLGACGSDIGENVIVDGNGGSMIAAAKTGDVANLNVIGAGAGEAALEIGAQLASAIEMTAHVRANANLRFRRRHKMKMRIKTGDAMKLIERRLRALGKTLEFRFGQEAVAKLDGPKVVEDHGAPSRAKSAGTFSKDARREVAC